MEINEETIDQYAVDTAKEEREQQLAEQQEADRIEQNIENAKEEAETDYDYLVKCMNLPFKTT